jgi:type VI secretion system secreted protein VgrG
VVELGEQGDWHRVVHDDDEPGCGCGEEHDPEHEHEHERDGQAAAAGGDDDAAPAASPMPEMDLAFARQLIDQLVFSDADVQQAIQDGEE